MSVLLEMIGRGWDNFLARPNGSLSLRFFVQPTMAALLALRAGIQDAKLGTAGLPVGGAYTPGEASAVAPRGLAGSDDAVPGGDRARLRLSAHDSPVCLSAGALVHGDFTGARPIRLVARTLQSPRAPVLAGCLGTAAGRTSPQQ